MARKIRMPGKDNFATANPIPVDPPVVHRPTGNQGGNDHASLFAGRWQDKIPAGKTPSQALSDYEASHPNMPSFEKSRLDKLAPIADKVYHPSSDTSGPGIRGDGGDGKGGGLNPGGVVSGVLNHLSGLSNDLNVTPHPDSRRIHAYGGPPGNANGGDTAPAQEPPTPAPTPDVNPPQNPDNADPMQRRTPNRLGIPKPQTP